MFVVYIPWMRVHNFVRSNSAQPNAPYKFILPWESLQPGVKIGVPLLQQLLHMDKIHLTNHLTLFAKYVIINIYSCMQKIRAMVRLAGGHLHTKTNSSMILNAMTLVWKIESDIKF